jgi:hypothetical protein
MRRRAFTLAELMTVFFLMLVVTGLILGLVGPSAMFFGTEAAASEAQQCVTMFRQRLQEGLLNSGLETVTLLDDPPAISWVPCVPDSPFNATGSPNLAGYFQIYFYDAVDKRARSKQWSGGGYAFDAGKPPVLSADDLKRAVLSTNGTERTVIRNVSALTFQDVDGAPLSPIRPPLVVSLTCEVKAVRPQLYTMDLHVTPRSIRW